MKLIKCTHDNGHFALLKAQWNAQVADDDVGPEEYFAPHLSAAEAIVIDDPTRPESCVYAVADGPEDGRLYLGLMHVNYAKVRRSVRVPYWYLAPRLHGVDMEALQVAPVISALVQGAVDLYLSKWKEADELKIYCPNVHDRTLIQSAVGYLKNNGMNLEASRGGSWMHIKMLAVPS